MPMLLVGLVPETNEIEINLWGGDAPPAILGMFNLDVPLRSISEILLSIG